MEQSFRGRMTDAGRIVIPAELRKEIELREGEELIFSRDAEGIRITSLKRAIRQAQELFTSLAPSEVVLSQVLLAERRREGSNE
jgi:AbrB family looped-hinge helix DNA binding protein